MKEQHDNTPRPQQEPLPSLPAELEDLLSRRAADESSQPWLELRVMRHVEAKEQARRWLKENPGGLLGNGRLLLEGSLAPRVLSTLGAGAVGALLGWQLASMSTVSIPWVNDLGTVAAVICALLAALATQLPQLRSMLSD